MLILFSLASRLNISFLNFGCLKLGVKFDNLSILNILFIIFLLSIDNTDILSILSFREVMSQILNLIFGKYMLSIFFVVKLKYLLVKSRIAFLYSSPNISVLKFKLVIWL